MNIPHGTIKTFSIRFYANGSRIGQLTLKRGGVPLRTLKIHLDRANEDVLKALDECGFFMDAARTTPKTPLKSESAGSGI